MDKKFVRAVAVLIGSTIGVGIYGIPYAVIQVGFPLGLLYLLALGLITLLLNLCYGELILRTAGDHQLAGYGQIYLGQKGKLVAAAGLFIGLYGAFLAYLIQIGQFLSLATGYNNPALLSLIFFVIASTVVIFGLKTVSQLDLFFVGLFLLLLAMLVIIGRPYFSYTNYLTPALFSRLFYPYGIILFALAGSSAIPEVEEILRQNHTQLKKAIIAGTLIPIIVYALFATIIVGISGNHTSVDAISGLASFLPGWIIRLGSCLGILTISTSILGLGYVLREVWHRDFQVPKMNALMLTLIPPLVLFLIGINQFLTVISISGALTGGLGGILIISCFYAARKTSQLRPAYQLSLPNWLAVIIILVFIIGFFSPFIR